MPKDVGELANRRVILDVCLTSNLRTGAVRSPAQHPLPALVGPESGALCPPTIRRCSAPTWSRSTRPQPLFVFLLEDSTKRALMGLCATSRCAHALPRLVRDSTGEPPTGPDEKGEQALVSCRVSAKVRHFRTEDSGR